MRIFFPASIVLVVSIAWAQTPAGPEINSQDAPLTFKSKVNLVLVPVVVRDRNGKPVGTLRQEDFQLFDKGKLQTITKFSVEKSGGKVIPKAIVERAPGEKPPDGDSLPVIQPDHFVAYLFDDVHLQAGDLMQVRQAALKHLADLKDSDRAAIYTTSGQTTLEFTDDRAQLRETLLKLAPRPIFRQATQECPDISYYMADLITNKNDGQALNVAATEFLVCQPLQTLAEAKTYVASISRRVLTTNEHETQVSMSVIKDVVRRMAAMPGQRVIVLVSPGFLRLNDQLQDETEIIDRAIRSNVIISALDARGLYAETPAQGNILKGQYDRASARAEADIMAELAAGTGGSFIENRNDLGVGLTELAASPETYYVLGFSPQNLKLDGLYHALKITVKPNAGLNVKARRGYYAPRHLSDADDDSEEEISQALFSREEMHDIPIEMHTQFFKSSEEQARLVILARVDVRKLRFRKVEGHNDNEVMIVSGLFDRNGNYLEGVSKLLKMRLKDETLQTRLNSGVTVRSDFKVAPGTYVIRLVVRDAEGQTMAAQNGAVEIP